MPRENKFFWTSDYSGVTVFHPCTTFFLNRPHLSQRMSVDVLQFPLVSRTSPAFPTCVSVVWHFFRHLMTPGSSFSTPVLRFSWIALILFHVPLCMSYSFLGCPAILLHVPHVPWESKIFLTSHYPGSKYKETMVTVLSSCAICCIGMVILAYLISCKNSCDNVCNVLKPLEM